jgi:hypothetical protein
MINMYIVTIARYSEKKYKGMVMVNPRYRRYLE